MFDAVFFDMDGTLIDTARDFERAVNGLLAAEQLPLVSLDAIRSRVSHGARALVQLAYGLQEGDNHFAQRLEQLLSAYEQAISADSRLFDGMDQVLDLLDRQHQPWGVVTNKPARFADPIMTALQLDQRAVATICPDHVTLRKPDPEGLLMVAQMAKVDPRRCLYVGDHERDIAAGRNAGMQTACALFGYIDSHDQPDTWQADHLLHTALDLLPLIRKPS